VRGRVDAIVSGIAINLAAAGATRFVLRSLYDSSSNSPRSRLSQRAPRRCGRRALLVRTLVDPLTIATALLVAASGWSLYRTRFGLRVRACGEDPVASASVGVDVPRVRLLAVSLGGAICGWGAWRWRTTSISSSPG